jgi:hypothetical protein
MEGAAPPRLEAQVDTIVCDTQIPAGTGRAGTTRLLDSCTPKLGSILGVSALVLQCLT